MECKVLNEFLSKKGGTAGNTSVVFYGSYVFFEKMGVRDKKPKSKHRQDMDKEIAEERSVNTKRRSDGRVWCLLEIGHVRTVSERSTRGGGKLFPGLIFEVLVLHAASLSWKSSALTEGVVSSASCIRSCSRPRILMLHRLGSLRVLVRYKCERWRS